jgi:hypothetical protein
MAHVSAAVARALDKERRLKPLLRLRHGRTDAGGDDEWLTPGFELADTIIRRWTHF